MERLDPPIHHLRETGKGRDFRIRNAVFGEQGGSAAGTLNLVFMALGSLPFLYLFWTARYAPRPLVGFGMLAYVLALASVALLLVAIGTLLWFFYWFFLRRLLRARRIANARFRRMMREREEQGNREGQ